MADKFNDLILQNLSCPICKAFCTSPIAQCSKGHIICGKCSQQTGVCPRCKHRITNVRNLFAEQLRPTVKFPCKYSDRGCTLKLDECEMRGHVKKCPFALRCQLKIRSHAKEKCYVPCDWSGGHHELVDHVLAVHKSNFSENATAMHEFPIKQREDVRLLQSTNQLFWSVMYFNFKTYTMRGMVFSIGAQDEAAKYGFKFELLSDTVYGIVHQGTVMSMQGLDLYLRKFFENSADSENGTAIFQGKATLKRLANASFINCRVTIAPKNGDVA